MSGPPPLPVPAEGESRAEFDLMVSGKPYKASDKYVQRIAADKRSKVFEINDARDDAKRAELFKKFVKSGKEGANFYILLPFFCEYGFNITIGDDVFIGTGCTILDVCPVTIGNRTMLGPNVQIYTPVHPISPEERSGLQGREWATPISIGDDCWIGGAAIILSGVKIGNGVTVGAGAVVTKDVPDRVVVVGNPARIVKEIPIAQV